MPDDDCIFCKIVAGELPAERVDEDEHTVAFMDINPWTRGHALVIPRQPLPQPLRDSASDDLANTARGGPSGWPLRMRDSSAPTA